MTRLITKKILRKVYRLALILVLIFANLALLVDALTTSAHAQTATPPSPMTGVRMQAQAAFDGYFKYGEWLPIWVELENNGPDREAVLRAPISTSAGLQVFTVPVELPAGARKRVAIYVLPNNFSRQIELSVTSGDEQLASKKVELNPQPTLTYQIGIISPRRGALSLVETINLPGIQRPVVLVDISLSELPEVYEGLRSFDLIVLNDTDTSALSPEQIQALSTWIGQGGRLVIGGGAGAERTLSGLTTVLPPMTNLTTHELDLLPGLEEYIDSEKLIRIPGPFVATAADSATSQTLVEQDGLPLVQEWSLDRGWIDFVALDLAGPPFDAWNGTVDFWQKLVSPGASFPEGAPVDMSARQQFASGMVYPLNNLPMLDLPSVRGLALLLGLYILLVGPVNYLILRKQKRLHLAWITIPAITLIFSAASFSLGYLLHGTDIFINKIAILQLLPSGKAKVDSYIGLFSPARSAYTVRVDDGGLISPLNPFVDPWMNPETSGVPSGRTVTLIQGDPAYINGLNVEQWSMQSFFSEGAQIDFGQIEADLRLEGDHMLGELSNQTSSDLQDAALIFGNKFIRLGDLSGGQTASVDMSLADASAPNTGPSFSYALYEPDYTGAGGPAARQTEVRRAIIESLFERTPPYISSRRSLGQASYLSQSPVLIGWIDRAPPDISLIGVQPSQQTTALVVAPLSLEFPESGAMSIPPGLIPGRILSLPNDGGQCGMPGTTGAYINRGEAVFEFNLPAEAQNIVVDDLKLTVYSDSGFFNPPAIAILNTETGDWVKLDGIDQGVNLIPEAAKFVDPSGAVKLTMTTENASNCFFLGLGLEGFR